MLVLNAVMVAVPKGYGHECKYQVSATLFSPMAWARFTAVPRNVPSLSTNIVFFYSVLKGSSFKI